MFSGGIFWFIMGMLFILVAVGAKAWSDSLRLKMAWWKWLCALVWYALLNFTVAGPMTFIGEREAGAGGKLFIFSMVLTIILGVALLRVLVSGREKKQG